MGFFDKSDFTDDKGNTLNRGRGPKVYFKEGRYLVKVLTNPMVKVSDKKGKNFVNNEMEILEVLHATERSNRKGDKVSYTPSNLFPDAWMRSILDYVGAALQSQGHLDEDIFTADPEIQQELIESVLCEDEEGNPVDPAFPLAGAVLDVTVTRKVTKKVGEDDSIKTTSFEQPHFKCPSDTMLKSVE